MIAIEAAPGRAPAGDKTISTSAFRPVRHIFETWIPVVLYTGLIFTLSSIPNLAPPGNFKAEDKMMHVGEYFVWGLLLRRALDRVMSGSRLAQAVSTVIVGAGLAFCDETFQRAVGRNYSYLDMTADMTGVILAQLLYRALMTRVFPPGDVSWRSGS